MSAEEIADRITATSPAASPWIVVVTGFVGLAIAAAPIRRSNPVLYHLNVLGTLLHEAGHAALALITSGTVHRLEITSADSGVTLSTTIAGIRSGMTTFAGYAAPPLAGLGAAALLDTGHAAAVITLLGVLALLALPMSRGALTLATTILTAAFAALLLWLNIPAVHVWAAHILTWLLLCSGLLALWPLVLSRGSNDATTLHDDTGIPWPLWVASWAALAAWCLWTGADLLWP